MYVVLWPENIGVVSTTKMNFYGHWYNDSPNDRL